MAKVSEENEEERGEKRKREEEKEENKTESAKRRCEGFASETWRVAVVFLGRIFWRSLRTGLILSLALGWKCMWCLL